MTEVHPPYERVNWEFYQLAKDSIDIMVGGCLVFECTVLKDLSMCRR